MHLKFGERKKQRLWIFHGDLIVTGDLLDKRRHIPVCYTGDKLLANETLELIEEVIKNGQSRDIGTMRYKGKNEDIQTKIKTQKS